MPGVDFPGAANFPYPAYMVLSYRSRRRGWYCLDGAQDELQENGVLMVAMLSGWSPEYKLGLNEIDAQHAALLDWHGRLCQRFGIDAGGEDVRVSFEAFEHYTKAHFVEEEAYMLEMKFPDLGAHRQLHQRFLARIAAEKHALIAGSPMTFSLLHFLHDWLVDHILVADKAYAEYVQHHKDETVLSRFFRRFG